MPYRMTRIDKNTGESVIIFNYAQSDQISQVWHHYINDDYKLEIEYFAPDIVPIKEINR